MKTNFDTLIYLYFLRIDFKNIYAKITFNHFKNTSKRAKLIVCQ